MATRPKAPIVNMDELDMQLAEGDALADMQQTELEVSDFELSDDDADMDSFLAENDYYEAQAQQPAPGAPDAALNALADHLLELRQYWTDQRWGTDENTMLNIAFRHGHQYVEVDRARRAVVEIPAPRDTVRRVIHRFEPWYKQLHGKLASGTPTPHVRPKTRQQVDRDAARFGEELVEWIIPQAYPHSRRAELAMWKILGGNAVLYCGVEWRAGGYMGNAAASQPELVFDTFPIHQCWVDWRIPNAQDMRWFGVDRYLPLVEARARYLDKQRFLVPESVTPERGLRMRNRMIDFTGPEDPFHTGRRMQTASEATILESEEDTVLPEFWGKPGIVMQFSNAADLDPNVVDFVVLDDGADTGTDPIVEFPQGLFVVFTTDGHIMEMGPNILASIPFYGSRFSKSPGFLGPAPATALRPIQQAINWTHNLREEGIGVRAQPKILAPHEARVKRRSFVSGVLEFIRYRANRFGAKPEYMNPGNMPADLSQFEQHLVTVWQDIASAHEVSQGKLPAADISGVAISLLQEQDLGSMGYAGEEEEEVFIEVVRRSLVYVQKFVPSTDPRLVQLAGDAPYLLLAFMTANLQEGLDIQVIKGSSIPRSPAAVEAKAKEGWQLGFIVDRFGRPDYRRMQQILGFGTADDLYAEEELDIQNARTEEETILNFPPLVAMGILQIVMSTGGLPPFLMPQPEDDHFVHELQHRTRLKALRSDPRATPVHIQIIRLHWTMHVMVLGPIMQATDPAVLAGTALQGSGALGMLPPSNGGSEQTGEGGPPQDKKSSDAAPNAA